MNENNTQNEIPNVNSKGKEERNVPDLGKDCYVNLKDICMPIEYGLGASAIDYDGKNIYVRITDIDDETSEFNYTKLSSPSFFDDKYLLENGDILIARTGASVGKSYLHYNMNNSYFAGFLMRIRLINHEPYYVYSQLKTNKFKKWLQIMSIRSGQPGINSKELGLYKIYITELCNEKKIGNILRCLDQRIVTQKKIIEELIDLKNGIKNIMLCLAETNGKFFTLKELALYFNGVAHENNISENGLTLINSKFISTEGQIKKYVDKSEFILNKNDICFVLSDLPNGKALSKCFYIDENNKYALNQRIACIRTRDVALSKYLYYYLSRNKYFLHFDDGVSQTNLKKDEVLKCPVYYDVSLNSFVAELEKIDDKILNEKKILSLYEQQKQYLLNKLFI